MAKGILANRGKKKYAHELLADVTISTATTTIDLTGLNLVKGEIYNLVITAIVNGSTNLYMYVNADTTTTNYFYQRVTAGGTTIDGTRSTTPMIMQWGTTASSMANVWFSFTEDGFFAFQSETARNYDLANNQRIENFYGGSLNSYASITRIQLTSSTASGLQSGTRIQLYRGGR